MIELLSIDLSNYCSKQCSFCYNHSHKEGNTLWQTDEFICFASDCISHGIKAVSLGGGEPFEYDGIFDIIDALYPKCYLSITTNGLPLENSDVWQKLTEHKPDKVHVTIHHPENIQEVKRVIKIVERLEKIGIKPGINLLVGKDKVNEASCVYESIMKILTPEQIILIPQRFSNTPTAKELALVAGNRPFQSPSCLLQCKKPTNFVSVSWDKKVNSCSYAKGKQLLESLDFNGLTKALSKVEFKSCM